MNSAASRKNARRRQALHPSQRSGERPGARPTGRAQVYKRIGRQSIEHTPDCRTVVLSPWMCGIKAANSKGKFAQADGRVPHDVIGQQCRDP
jgi:hypothetical protein